MNKRMVNVTGTDKRAKILERFQRTAAILITINSETKYIVAMIRLFTTRSKVSLGSKKPWQLDLGSSGKLVTILKTALARVGNKEANTINIVFLWLGLLFCISGVSILFYMD